MIIEVEIIKANLKENDNSVEKRKKRVCAYARVSTDSEEQLTSYSSQIKHYSAKIEANPEWEFAGIYADEGISGTQVKNRNEFKRMIDDALNGKIDMIIAKSISRFARNTVDTLEHVRLLRDKKVNVFFEKENINTLNLDSEMFLTLYSAFAQAESESTSMNVRMGLKAMMKRGEAVGRCECYGYIWNKETKTLEINEEQAKVVKRIFDWYVNQYGGRSIAKMLNDEKIPTFYGSKWTQASIKDIVQNEKYMGDLCGQKFYTTNPLTHKCVKNYGEKEKYYVRNHHEPIISREQWEKAQAIRKKRNTRNTCGHSSNCSNRYAFSGKISCGFCGTYAIRKSMNKKKDGSYTKYWLCYAKTWNSQECKDSVSIREETLENVFVELYNRIVKDKHKTKEKLLNAIKETISDNNYTEEISNLENEEQKLKNRLSNLIDLKLDGCIDKEAYVTKEQELKQAIEKITVEKNNLMKLNNENNDITDKIREIEKIVVEPAILTEFDREIFDNMVERVVIGEINENGEKIPNVIRFVLKTGESYVEIFTKKKEKLCRQKPVNKMELNGSENVV